jgi:hypothetical protein
LQLYISGLILTVVAAMVTAGRSLMAPAAEEVLEHDKRPPVIYLRPFDEDDRRISQLPVGTRNGGKPVINLFRPASHEGWLARASKAIGPFVAVGRPGDGLAPLGAARFYLADDEWQQKVDALLRGAAAIVLCPETSTGTRWEVAEVAQLIDHRRVLLVVPNPAVRPLGYARIRTATQKTWPLPDRSENTDAFMFDDEGGPQPLTLAEKSSETLRAFVDQIHRLQGVGTDTKAQPQQPHSHHVVAWIGRSIAILGGLLLAFAIGTNSWPVFQYGLLIEAVGLPWLAIHAWWTSDAMRERMKKARAMTATTTHIADAGTQGEFPDIPFRIEGGNLVCKGSSGEETHPLDLLIWAYAEQFSIRHRYQLVLWNRDAVATVLPVNAQFCNAALNRLRQAVPWMPVGFSNAMKESWNADRADLLELIDSYRQAGKRFDVPWAAGDAVIVQLVPKG